MQTSEAGIKSFHIPEGRDLEGINQCSGKSSQTRQED